MELYLILDGISFRRQNSSATESTVSKLMFMDAQVAAARGTDAF